MQVLPLSPMMMFVLRGAHRFSLFLSNCCGEYGCLILFLCLFIYSVNSHSCVTSYYIVYLMPTITRYLTSPNSSESFAGIFIKKVPMWLRRLPMWLRRRSRLLHTPLHSCYFVSYKLVFKFILSTVDYIFFVSL